MNSRKGFTLVEMLGVLAIIAILISVIAVGVLSAINRARIVATVANFKNLETAVVGFVALPNSGGTVPLTQPGAGNTTPIRTYDGSAFADAANDATYTLDQVLRASGLIDRPMQWRVGNDGMSQVVLTQERIFMLSRNAWSDGLDINGVTPGTGNDWTTFNRTECAPVNGSAAADGATATWGDIYDATNGVNFYIDGRSALKASRVAYVLLKNVSLKDAKKLSAELNGALDDSETQDDQFKGRLVYAAPTAPATSTDVYYYLGSF